MRLLIFILCFLLATGSSAKNLDSLFAAISSAEVSVKIKVATEQLHQARRLDSAEFYGLQTRIANEWPQLAADLKAAMVVSQAEWLFNQGENERALVLLQSNEAVWQAKEDFFKVQADLLLGHIYQDIGLMDKSLERNLEALRVSTIIQDTGLMLRSYNYIGEAYRHVNEYESAISYFERGIALSDQLGKPSPRLLNNLALALIRIGKFEEAKASLEKGLAAAKNEGDEFGEARLLTNLGFILKEVHKLDKALEYYLLSLNIKKRLGSAKSLAYTLNDIGEVLSLQGKYEAALVYSREALSLAKKEKVIYYMRDMNLTLAQIFEPMGELDSAYYYFKTYHALHDSIDNIDNARNLARIEKLQELNEKERENSFLHQENAENNDTIRNQRMIQVLLLIILALMTAFGVMVYRSAQNRKQLLIQLENKNNQLSINNAKLSRLLNEQESLFDIVAHDVKGPLSNMVTLLNLEEQETDADTKNEMRKMIATSARGALQFIQDYDYLHKFEKSQSIPEFEPFNLTQLIETVLVEFEPHIARKNLNVHFDKTKALQLNSIESFVRHIIYNLLSNAVKFSPENGDIFINIIQTDRTRVSIEDQGPGIPEKYQDRIFERFFRGSAQESLEGYRSSGLGLALVKLMVDKLNGDLKLKSAPGKGTEVIVYLS